MKIIEIVLITNLITRLVIFLFYKVRNESVFK